MAELTCQELIDFLDDYVEGRLEAELRARFEVHLERCPYCVDYLKTYRDTISFARGACADNSSLPAPPDVPEELIQAILKSRRASS